MRELTEIYLIGKGMSVMAIKYLKSNNRRLSYSIEILEMFNAHLFKK